MVELKQRFQTPQAPRSKRLEERERIREATMVPNVRVEPGSDTMRRILRHPSAGGFRSVGGAEWPDDTFTQRRLRDGDITLAKDQRRPA
jgi:hypothetical protein